VFLAMILGLYNNKKKQLPDSDDNSTVREGGVRKVSLIRGQSQKCPFSKTDSLEIFSF
jgi:hypothetical protein